MTRLTAAILSVINATNVINATSANDPLREVHSVNEIGICVLVL